MRRKMHALRRGMSIDAAARDVDDGSGDGTHVAASFSIEPGKNADMTEGMEQWLKPAIGWTASALLLITLIAQVRKQYRSGATTGVSRRLFVGQIASSLGFLLYSILVGDRIFVFTNACILATAVVGEIVYLRNRRAQRRGG